MTEKGAVKAFCLLLFLPIFALSCAGMGVGARGAYIGMAKGLYASVHYKVEDNRLLIAFENTTTTAMSNLIISVSQRTSAGNSDMQGSVRLLKVRNIYQMQVSLAPNATGEVRLSYYFVPKAEGGIGLSPYQRGDFADNTPGSEYGSFMDDTVEFRIALP